MSETPWVILNGKFYCGGDAAVVNLTGAARQATTEEIRGKTCAGCGTPAVVND